MNCRKNFASRIYLFSLLLLFSIIIALIRFEPICCLENSNSNNNNNNKNNSNSKLNSKLEISGLSRRYMASASASIERERPKKNSHVIFKKLIPIEIYENVAIGYPLIDLRASLIDQQLPMSKQHKYDDAYYSSYFNFEFIYGSDGSDHQATAGAATAGENKYLSHFLIDPLTGIIKTTKSLDLENFCDLNFCSNNRNGHLIPPINSGSGGGGRSGGNELNCVVSFTVKALKFNSIANKNSSRPSAATKDSIYHISFDLIIHDQNEFAPEFERKEPFVFNVTEEFAPIKLPIGSLATDNDCSDRNSLAYQVRILRVNNRPVDEYLLRNSAAAGMKYQQQKATRMMDESLKNSENNFLGIRVLAEHEQTLLFLLIEKPLDREMIETVELLVIVSDRESAAASKINSTMLKTTTDSAAKSGQLKVVLNVADVNDHAPRFENQIYNLEFDEGLEESTELIKLKAFDPDQGANGQVRYEFAVYNSDIRDHFKLDPITGSLSLKRKLDYNLKKMWQLSIRAVDQSLSVSSRKSAIAIVNLRVNDINNHKPDIYINFLMLKGLIEPRILTEKYLDKETLSKEEVIYISRNLPDQTVIGIVTVTDKDSDWNGFVEKCDVIFDDTINNDQNKRNLPVYLEEIKLMPASTTKSNKSGVGYLVRYSVDDQLNYEISYLLKNEMNKLNEEQNSNRNDDDDDEFTRNEKKFFMRINSANILIESNRLKAANKTSQMDMQPAQKKQASSFELSIVASDKGIYKKLTNKKNFKLLIFEANNLNSGGFTNRQVGKQSNNNKNNDENESETTADDYEDNSEESDNDEGYFDDDDDANLQHNEDVAEDNYEEDVDQQLLSLGKSTFKVRIFENNNFPIELIKLNASDLDLHSPVKYELLNSISNDDEITAATFFKKMTKLLKCSADLYPFLSMDAMSGVIQLNKSLDREECAGYLFEIKATDLIDNRLISSFLLKIDVNDVNDNAPKFEQAKYVFHIMENTAAATSNTIKVCDPDMNPNLSFSVEEIPTPIIHQNQKRKQKEKEKEKENHHDDVSSIFGVQSDRIINGCLLLKLLIKRPLDFELRNRYQFNLIVSEEKLLDNISGSGGNLRSTDVTTVEVNVLDANEHKPTVEKILSTYHLSYSTSKQAVNVSRMSLDEFLVVANADCLVNDVKYIENKVKPNNYDEGAKSNLIRLAAATATAAAMMINEDDYISFLKIEATDADMAGKNAKLKYSIVQVDYFDFELNHKLETKSGGGGGGKTDTVHQLLNKVYSFPSDFDSANLFLINEHNGIIKLNLNQLQQKSGIILPIVAFVSVKVSDMGDTTLHTIVNFRILLVNNSTMSMMSVKLREIKNYLIDIYSSSSFLLVQQQHSNGIYNFGADKKQHEDNLNPDYFIASTNSDESQQSSLMDASSSTDRRNAINKYFFFDNVVHHNKKTATYSSSIRRILANVQSPILIISGLAILFIIIFIIVFIFSLSVNSKKVPKMLKCRGGGQSKDGSSADGVLAADVEKASNNSNNSNDSDNMIIMTSSPSQNLLKPTTTTSAAAATSGQTNQNSLNLILTPSKIRCTPLRSCASTTANPKIKTVKPRSLKQKLDGYVGKILKTATKSKHKKEAEIAIGDCKTNRRFNATSSSGDKENVDYLLDSPIMVKKIYESNDAEAQKKYMKKYHLEYLFEDGTAAAEQQQQQQPPKQQQQQQTNSQLLIKEASSQLAENLSTLNKLLNENVVSSTTTATATTMATNYHQLSEATSSKLEELNYDDSRLYASNSRNRINSNDDLEEDEHERGDFSAGCQMIIRKQRQTDLIENEKNAATEFICNRKKKITFKCDLVEPMMSNDCTAADDSSFSSTESATAGLHHHHQPHHNHNQKPPKQKVSLSLPPRTFHSNYNCSNKNNNANSNNLQRKQLNVTAAAAACNSASSTTSSSSTASSSTSSSSIGSHSFVNNANTNTTNNITNNSNLRMHSKPIVNRLNTSKLFSYYDDFDSDDLDLTDPIISSMRYDTTNGSFPNRNQVSSSSTAAAAAAIAATTYRKGELQPDHHIWVKKMFNSTTANNATSNNSNRSYNYSININSAANSNNPTTTTTTTTIPRINEVNDDEEDDREHNLV